MSKPVDIRGNWSNYTEWMIYLNQLDGETVARPTIDYVHHEIHEGNSYVLTQRTALNAFDIAAPISFLIQTPNTVDWMNLVISGESNNPSFWELYRDTGNLLEFNVAGGAAVIPVNRNGNSANLSGAVVTTAPVITVAGAAALLASEAIGRSSSGADRQEFILAQNTAHLVRATSYIDNNEGSLSLNWYHHETWMN